MKPVKCEAADYFLLISTEVTLQMAVTEHLETPHSNTLSVVFIESKLCTDTFIYSFGHTSKPLLWTDWECIKYNLLECNSFSLVLTLLFEGLLKYKHHIYGI